MGLQKSRRPTSRESCNSATPSFGRPVGTSFAAWGLKTLPQSSDGGSSGVHEHSMAILADTCFCAVGPYVVALALPGLDLRWSRQADESTCFGVFVLPGDAGLVSHGEQLISRLTLSGELVWQAGGADIFSGAFSIAPTSVVAEDFAGRRYSFDLTTGRNLEPLE